MDRRKFVSASLLTGSISKAASKSALLGGDPVRKSKFPSWPVVEANDETGLRDVLRGGKWGRGNGKVVARFEDEYARLMGSKACLAAANGTSALLTALNVLNVGPGDEVIVPPYTFIATVNVVLQQFALPVFVDTDRETLQIDASKIEAVITPRTALLMPVHLGGAAFDVDAVMAIAAKRSIPVLEDACQSHLAEWKNRKVGTFGRMGCFSFQASKNLNCGEGGAILSDDEALIEAAYTFHNNSRPRAAVGAAAYSARGLNLRLTEFQGSLLLSQMKRLAAQTSRRETNAAYLTDQLRQIPGIMPAKTYPGNNRNAYHLYMFRYDAGQFNGLSRAKFLKALTAEGIPASGGYQPLNREPFLKNTLESKAYRRIYGDKAIKEWFDRNHCPQNDKLCTEAVWLTQTVLLGSRGDMDDIVAAIQKVKDQSPALAKT